MERALQEIPTVALGVSVPASKSPVSQSGNYVCRLRTITIYLHAFSLTLAPLKCGTVACSESGIAFSPTSSGSACGFNTASPRACRTLMGCCQSNAKASPLAASRGLVELA